ncbi:ABC transporter ATP-binding protein [Dactylosporangium sp. NPDC000244]|uniref:ABC transporter ATP-binding protein n=1 Tax=Dactylosporangium sp. NPDC000244 TaxID=3154365 RepID=UPI00331EF55B
MRKVRRLFAVLPRGDRALAAAWWGLVAFGGLLPSAFSVTVGVLVSALQRGDSPRTPLVLLGAVFVAGLVQAPILSQVGANLGDRVALHLHRQLLVAATAPQGVEHLESHERAGDLAVARDFDTGMSGPQLSLSLGIISGGLVMIITGVIQALLLFGLAWWAPLLIGAAWASTHVLLRESTSWDLTQDEVRASQQRAEYTYSLGVAGPAAKEIRVFGLTDWLVGRFVTSRRDLVDRRLHSTRVRQRPLRWALLILLAANVLLFWWIARQAGAGHIDSGRVVVFAQAAVGASLIAFGGFNWALALAADNVESVLRAERGMAETGALPSGTQDADGLPAAEIRFRDVRFTYPGQDHEVLSGLDLVIPAGTSLAVVGLNGQGKTTLIKLLCRLYDPTSGQILVDGKDLREYDVTSWRRRLTAVFQDFARYELPLRENVAPLGAPDEVVLDALADAGAADLRRLDTVLAPGYDDGTDLSGGQWQRVAIARALAAVRQGAGVVVLDEPTAQLDVRGEAEIFDRVLAATRACTTLLISHRFSTVRHADRICVLSDGRVAELGTHDELMALGGSYRVMFDMQASRFDEEDTHRASR